MSKALIELTSVDRNISTKYNELKHLNELTQIREDMFEYYRAIDRGDVIDWPIELLQSYIQEVKFIKALCNHPIQVYLLFNDYL